MGCALTSSPLLSSAAHSPHTGTELAGRMTALNVPDLLMASQSSGLSSIRKLSGNAKLYGTRSQRFV